MPKRYSASMSIAGYTADNGQQPIVNLCLYGPRGGVRALETLTIGEAKLLAELIDRELEQHSIDQGIRP